MNNLWLLFVFCLGEEYNFDKYSHGDIDKLQVRSLSFLYQFLYLNNQSSNCAKHDLFVLCQVPYDYKSIMHYGRKSFSKNGQPTILSIRDPNQEMGQRKGFTEFDLREINSLYDCSSKYVKNPF